MNKGSPLPAGTRLGPYEVVALLGRGGMADVYRARDTRLNNRVVAIKILGTDVADTPRRRQRFEREAKAASLLSHPNICTLFDVGDEGGRPYLVMEFIAGETLAQRLRRGPLPIAEALRLAIPMADALDHAHRQGVVHRDLKPANIMLSPAGPKLVDFGLAKLRDPDSGETSVTDDTESVSSDGMLLGTLPYMAPEQVEAKQADARSDVFAFGAVLYEMIMARRAFDATSKAGLMVAILEHDPPSLESSLQGRLGPEASAVPIRLLDHVIARCLAKQPEDRWQTAADLKRELRWIADSHWSVAPRRTTPRPWLAATLVVAVVAVVLAAAHVVSPLDVRSGDPPGLEATFSVPLAAGTTFVSGPAAPQAAVSPDGRLVALTAGPSAFASQLWLYRLSDGNLRALPNTEGADHPFWSPDSQKVGFFAHSHLQVTGLDDNAPVVLALAPQPNGGAWGADDTIVFAPGQQGSTVQRVSIKTHQVEPATRVDEANGELWHSWPAFLPDGRHFVYFVKTNDKATTGIALGSIAAGPDASRFVMSSLTAAVFARGSLLYGRNGTIFSRPFDWSSPKKLGDEVAILTGVADNPGNGRMAFSASESTLVYRRGAEEGATRTRLDWKDPHGTVVGTLGEPGHFGTLSGSPDGRYVLASTDGASALTLFNLRTGARQHTPAPFTFSQMIWAPDSSAFVYSLPSGDVMRWDLQSGRERRVFHIPKNPGLSGWSPDGRTLLYMVLGETSWDVWEAPLGTGQPRPLLASPDKEGHAQFAPGGRWIAYVSDEGGPMDVWVRPYPLSETKFKISVGGGYMPQWRADGRALYYLDRTNQLVELNVTLDPTFRQGLSHQLFQGTVNQGLAQTFVNQYVVSPDGQRFLFKTPLGDDAPLMVSVNWTLPKPH